MQCNKYLSSNFQFHFQEYISDAPYLHDCSAQRHKSSFRLYCAKSYANTQRAFSTQLMSLKYNTVLRLEKYGYSYMHKGWYIDTLCFI